MDGGKICKVNTGYQKHVMRQIHTKVKILMLHNHNCEGHAKASQYLSSLGLGHYHPSQDKHSHTYPKSGLGLHGYLSQEINTYPL